MNRPASLLLAAVIIAGCGARTTGPAANQYESATVERRALVLVVEAAGVIEPIRTVELKSKASGEILELGADTGDTVQAGALLVRIDPRIPRNRLDQALAQHNAAKAKLATARSQLERGEKLRENAWINPADYDKLVLDAATADFTWALILATARRLTEAEAWLRAGEWQGWKLKQFLGMDVQGATLGIVGMGRIGQAVAKRARGFDMPVLYCNRTRLAPALERDCNARPVTLDELLAQADIVTLHTPYSADSHHLIGAAQLAKMKNSAILIHAARGGVVDDAALVAALRNGTIAAAGLDVFENEPKFNPEFLKLSNVVLAPHIASATTSTRRNMAMLAARNLAAALTGDRPPNPLTPDALK